jgi:hypothetical protein
LVNPTECLSATKNEVFIGFRDGNCEASCPQKNRCHQLATKCCMYKSQSPNKLKKDHGKEGCPPPRRGESFIRSETRQCDARCLYTRCKQRGVNCCYYQNPRKSHNEENKKKYEKSVSGKFNQN